MLFLRQIDYFTVVLLAKDVLFLRLIDFQLFYCNFPWKKFTVFFSPKSLFTVVLFGKDLVHLKFSLQKNSVIFAPN